MCQESIALPGSHLCSPPFILWPFSLRLWFPRPVLTCVMRSECGVTVSPCPLLRGVVSSSPISSFCLRSCQGEEVSSLCCTQEGTVTRPRAVSQKDWVYFFFILETLSSTSICPKTLRCEKLSSLTGLGNVPCLQYQWEVFGRVLMGGRCSPCRLCRVEVHLAFGLCLLQLCSPSAPVGTEPSNIRDGSFPRNYSTSYHCKGSS